MHESNSETFARTLAQVAVTFERDLTDALMTTYWQSLKPLSIEQFQECCAKWIVEESRMPRPADLIAMVLGDAEQHAMEAWDDVQAAAPLGAYAHVCFSDTIINAVIRSLGGWPAMFDRCCNADKEQWYRQHFMKAYVKFRGTASSHQCRPLPGKSQVEIRNGERIHPVPRRIPCANEQRLQHAPRLARPKLAGLPFDRTEHNQPLLEMKTP